MLSIWATVGADLPNKAHVVLMAAAGCIALVTTLSAFGGIWGTLCCRPEGRKYPLKKTTRWLMALELFSFCFALLSVLLFAIEVAPPVRIIYLVYPCVCQAHTFPCLSTAHT